MSSYGVTLVSRNDNYGGRLAERAIYALNSCIVSYDEVIYVDWNSRGETLHSVIKDSLLHTGKLRCITVNPAEHHMFTKHYPGAQPCSEVLGRNVGLRRLTTDFMVSTNIDEINPPRRFLESFTDKNKFISVARRGASLEAVQALGSPDQIDEIRERMLGMAFPQSWAVTREPYSMVEWCGDLQMAHRDVWHTIRGYEESQLGVGVHDSFIHRKAKEAGYIIEPSYEIPIWHLDHNKISDYKDEPKCVGESTECLYGDYIGNNNLETWGFSGAWFKEEII
jgi:hypothetical protein